MASDILKKILATKAREISDRSVAQPLGALREQCEQLSGSRGFAAAIENKISDGKPAVICEIKKASPSKGVIRANFFPGEIASDYAANGATCLSVLTDRDYFQGRDDFIQITKSSCELPVLRKDFTIDPYQVYEARAIGADAILLIVAALGDSTMSELANLALDLGMDVLVEVHNRKELDRAIGLPCQLVGINNRNLHTFETSLDTTFDLLEGIPGDRIVVTESGIREPRDVYLMQRHGVYAFLVGEAFMRAPSPGQKLRELFPELA